MTSITKAPGSSRKSPFLKYRSDDMSSIGMSRASTRDDIPKLFSRAELLEKPGRCDKALIRAVLEKDFFIEMANNVACASSNARQNYMNQIYEWVEYLKALQRELDLQGPAHDNTLALLEEELDTANAELACL